MLQHWELGQALRQRYHGFLNASYHRQEVRLGAREQEGIGCSHALPSGRLPVTWALWPPLHASQVTAAGQDVHGLSGAKL